MVAVPDSVTLQDVVFGNFRMLIQSFSHQTLLPAAIQPSVLIHLAWGNTNILAKTLTYRGSHLLVNGMSTQGKVCGPHLPKATLPSSKKQKQINDWSYSNCFRIGLREIVLARGRRPD